MSDLLLVLDTNNSCYEFIIMWWYKKWEEEEKEEEVQNSVKWSMSKTDKHINNKKYHVT